MLSANAIRIIMVSEPDTEPRQAPNLSHPLFGDILRELLAPVDIIVEQDQRVLSAPPRVDVILIRPRGDRWTKEQRARLPDGIRDTTAPRVLLELKYSESFSTDACTKTLCYDLLYRQSKRLPAEEVASFLVSSMSARESLLTTLGYQAQQPGVYRSTDVQRQRVAVILLNNLPPSAHNAAFQCFASRRAAYLQAFERLGNSAWTQRSRRLMGFLVNLWRLLMQDEPAFERPLPEDIERIERILAHGLLQTMSIDEVLDHFSADEVLKHYPSDEVLKHYPSDEVLKHYSSDEVLKHYSIEDMQEAIRRKQQAPH